MCTADKVENFVDELSSYSSSKAFNPWNSNCSETDFENSFSVRQENLRSVLHACVDTQDVDVWIGRDLGWRGGRRTGIALVDEASLKNYARSLDLPELVKATAGPVMRERTATEIHLARARISKRIFFWNVFPFHPHEQDRPHTNRMHTRSERETGLYFLMKVLELMPVRRVITIGNDATRAIREAEIQCFPVRHPSYGGQKDFHQQINFHYQIAEALEVQTDMFEHWH